MLPEIFAGCARVAPHVREGRRTLLRFLPLALGAAFEAHLGGALLGARRAGGHQRAGPPRRAGRGARLRGGVLAQRPQPGPAAARDRGGAGPRELAHPRERDRASGEHDVPHRGNEREGARGGRGRRRGHLHRGAGRVAHAGARRGETPRPAGVGVRARDRTPSWRAERRRAHLEDGRREHAAHAPNDPAVPHAPAHRGLSASAEDRRQTAGKCLGELVRKLGERVLPEIFPILRDGLEPSRSRRPDKACASASRRCSAPRARSSSSSSCTRTSCPPSATRCATPTRRCARRRVWPSTRRSGTAVRTPPLRSCRRCSRSSGAPTTPRWRA